MAEGRYFSYEQFAGQRGCRGLDGKIADQLLRMHDRILEMDEPIVLELGTWKGQSTVVLGEAAERRRGRMVSVDIDDCSDVLVSPAWTFVRSDDRDARKILEAAPFLRNGIDLLYIDSLHRRSHVLTLFETWYPFIKQNGWIFFDDIDEHPYRAGERKSSFGSERNRFEVRMLIRELFRANEDDLLLSLHFGSTGLAEMRKLGALGTPPRRPVRERNRIAVRLGYWLKGLARS